MWANGVCGADAAAGTAVESRRRRVIVMHSAGCRAGHDDWFACRGVCRNAGNRQRRKAQSNVFAVVIIIFVIAWLAFALVGNQRTDGTAAASTGAFAACAAGAGCSSDGRSGRRRYTLLAEDARRRVFVFDALDHCRGRQDHRGRMRRLSRG